MKMFSFSFIVLFSLAPFQAIAADLRIFTESNYASITIEGEIEEGDYERFLELVEQAQGKVSGVVIYSPGGDLIEAMKIGRAMRKLELSSMVPIQDANSGPNCPDDFFQPPRDPTNCTAASAAFFIHVGGIFRGGTYLAVHRPIFDPKSFGSLTESEAEEQYGNLTRLSQAYLEEMGVPNAVIDEVMNTPSDKIRVLSEDVVRTHFWGYSPARGEWIRAKCNTFTSHEEAELSQLSKKLLSQGAEISDRDFSRHQVLDEKREGDKKCELKVAEDLRKAAFEDFFGSEPSEATLHEFNIWVESAKYLGQRFDALVGFGEEESALGTSYLRKAQTVTAPLLTVYDRPDDPHLVDSIAVLWTTADEEFADRLVNHIVDAWGQPFGSSIAEGLEWQTEDFIAVLLLHPVSANGPYLVLDIQRK